jgi:hypothetical protein
MKREDEKAILAENYVDDYDEEGDLGPICLGFLPASRPWKLEAQTNR